MIPQAIQMTVPIWVQAALAATAILVNLATGAFVLLVLWPSIRNQERRAARLERWLDSAEGERLRRMVISKVEGIDGLSKAGKPVASKDAFRPDQFSHGGVQAGEPKANPSVDRGGNRPGSGVSGTLDSDL